MMVFNACTLPCYFHDHYIMCGKANNRRYDLTLPAVSKLPDFLREHNYSNPSDYDTCPMQWAVGKSQFEWLAERPKHQQMFDSYMSSRRQGKKEWFEVYPYYERLLSHLPKWQSGEMSNKQEQEVFIVDVGGNKGHNLQRLVENNQKGSLMGNINGSQTLEELGLPGRLVLQDLPAIIAKAPHIEGVEQMAYSFFDPQPVKGGFPDFRSAPQNPPSSGLMLIYSRNPQNRS